MNFEHRRAVGGVRRTLRAGPGAAVTAATVARSFTLFAPVLAVNDESSLCHCNLYAAFDA